ncbi:MAG: PAS domain S-box protein [Chlorobi bacterium]|nr:PAS domain S-box protein [Chlorobiota bacterium]
MIFHNNNDISCIHKDKRSKDSSKVYITDERYKSLLEISPAGVYMIQEGKVIYSNPKLIELLGYNNLDEITGRPVTDFILPKYHHIARKRMALALQKIGSKINPLEETFVKKDGSTINVIVVSSSMIYLDKPTIQGYVFDISRILKLKKKLKKRNKKLLKQKKELIKARNEAMKADRLKSAFLANISHEIRTPMNSIIGFSSLLAQDTKSPENKQYADIINDNCNILLNLIEDIIEISNIETEQVKITNDNYHINEIIDNLYYKFNNTFEHKNIQFIRTKPESDIVMYTDDQKLSRILSNLLSNAFKFTEKGKIEFGYRVINSDDYNEIEFFVTDTGKGINSSDAELIFDRFTKLSETDSKIYSGTGIGLNMVKKLTDMLGGSIRVESRLNEGTAFFIKFPLNPV